MDAQKLKQAVLDAASQLEGKTKLACAEALALSEAFKVSPSEIGRICNENAIKISQCQLGCFK
jgi:hypothetical protein